METNFKVIYRTFILFNGYKCALLAFSILCLNGNLQAQDTLFLKNGSIVSCHVIFKNDTKIYYQTITPDKKITRVGGLNSEIDKIAFHPSKDLYYNVKPNLWGIRLFIDFGTNGHYYKKSNSYGKNPWNGKIGVTAGYKNLYLNCEYGQVRDHRKDYESSWIGVDYFDGDLINENNYVFSIGYGYDINPYFTEILSFGLDFSQQTIAKNVTPTNTFPKIERFVYNDIGLNAKLKTIMGGTRLRKQKLIYFQGAIELFGTYFPDNRSYLGIGLLLVVGNTKNSFKPRYLR